MRMTLAACCLVAGEACGFALHAAATAWPWMAGLLAFAILVAYGWNIRGCLLPFAFAAGVVLAAKTESVRQNIVDATCFRAVPEAQHLLVEGRVNVWKSKKHAGKSVDFLSHLGPLPVKVVMAVAEGESTPSPGETWWCQGRLASTQSGTNLFGRHTFWVRGSGKARRLAAAEETASRRYAKTSAALASQASLGLGWAPELAGLNHAMLLGQRSALDPSRRKTFAAAGTIHVFAISGLHVMMLAWMLNGILARLDIPLAIRGLVTIPAVAAYVMLTGMRPSAIRAAMMMALYLLAPVFGRRPDAQTAWGMAAIAVYGSAPARIYDIGCTLSFAVMLGIVLWVRWSGNLQPLVAAGTMRQKFLGNLGVSFAAWAAGAPIIAQTFGRLSLGGLFANIAVVICAQWTVRFGAFGIAASLICIPLAAIANNLAALCTWLMAFISETVASIPHTVIDTTRWTALHSVSWYVFWAAAGLAAKRFLPCKTPRPGPWWL